MSQVENRLCLSFAAAVLLALPSVAFADTFTTVITDPNAAPAGGNFGTPTLGAPVGYTIAMSDDGTSLHVVLTTTDPLASVVGDFANLYFDTDADNHNGSNLGFETTNYDAFIPGDSDPADTKLLGGVTGYSATTSDSGGIHIVSVTIPNSFFLTDPLHMGFTKTADGGDVTLRLSQSFSYTVAGGFANYSSIGAHGEQIELGEATITSPVPEPAGLTYMALSGFGLLAEAGRRLRGRKNA